MTPCTLWKRSKRPSTILPTLPELAHSSCAVFCYPLQNTKHLIVDVMGRFEVIRGWIKGASSVSCRVVCALQSPWWMWRQFPFRFSAGSRRHLSGDYLSSSSRRGNRDQRSTWNQLSQHL